MKKILIFALCAMTVFGSVFAGCNGTTSAADDVVEEKPTTIGDEPISFGDTNEYFVKDGASSYKIVVSADAGKVEKYAAEEIKYFIEKSTAVSLPIATDAEVSYNNDGKYISVGENKLLAAQTDITVDYEELGENGVTVNTKGNCVYLSGATENGTLFAAYRFLHYQVGYNAYAYDCVEVDYYTTLKLKDISYKHVPSLGLTTAEDGELSGEEKVTDAMRMYIYASKNGGYDFNGNLYNGLWCHTTPYLVSQDLDAPRVKTAEAEETAAKLDELKETLCQTYNYKEVNRELVPAENADTAGYENFMKGFNKAAETLFASTRSSQESINSEVLNMYKYILDRKRNIVPQYVQKTTVNDKGETVPVIENGNYVYETDADGNPILKTDENGKPVSDVAGFTAYENGWNAAYASGNYHVGAEWQRNVKSIRLWNNRQVCYSKQEAIDLASNKLINNYINTASGPYLMLGVTDGIGSCDCDECRENETLYGGAAGVQMRFMNAVARNVEAYMDENGINKTIYLVAFAYYSYRQPPVKLVNGEYVAVDESVIPKKDGKVRVGVMYTPIEACYTHPISDEVETCDKNAQIAEEMKAWASIADYLMMYSYGTNFQAYKYHFNNWSHIGDSIRFYEKCGLKYYFEQACAQNGISPMSSMRAYVRSKLAWNSAYNTQDLIDEFIEHYYGDGAESVKQYFGAVMENFERIYTIDGTEDHNIYYSKITNNESWTRLLVKELQSYLEKADYKIDVGSSNRKDVYKERVFREYFLLKDCEYMKYSGYLNQEEYDELERLVMYGREKYNAYLSTEKTNNG